MGDSPHDGRATTDPDKAGAGPRRARARAGAGAHRPRADARRAHRRTRRHPGHRGGGRRRAGGARADPGRRAAPAPRPARRAAPRTGSPSPRTAPSRSPPRCTPTASGPRWSASAAGSSPPRPAARPSTPTRRRCSARSSRRARELLRETGRRCVGAGLAVPSAVAEPEGTALNPLHLAWPAGAPVREIFAERCPRGAGIDGPRLRRQRRQPRRARRAPARRRARRPHLLVRRHRAPRASAARWSSTAACTPAVRASPWRSAISPSTPRARPCHCGSRGCLDVEADPLAFLTAARPRPGPRGVAAPAGQRPAPHGVRRTRRCGRPPRR